MGKYLPRSHERQYDYILCERKAHGINTYTSEVHQEMSESFICRRGGVGTPFAVIGGTYPEGSTCTCSDGTKTLTAKGTSGQAMFNIPSTGTWTVSCTDGTDSASEDVSITAKGQVETVDLAYGHFLYRYGNEFSTETGGWEATADYSQGNHTSVAPTLILGSDDLYAEISEVRKDGVVRTKNLINLVGVSSIKVNVTGVNVPDSAEVVLIVMPTATGNWVSGNSASVYISETGDITLDVSNVGTSCYVGFALSTGGPGGTASLRLTSVELI